MEFRDFARIEQKKLTHDCHGNHDWSSWSESPMGLMRECKICQKTDLVRSSWFWRDEEDKIRWKNLIAIN